PGDSWPSQAYVCSTYTEPSLTIFVDSLGGNHVPAAVRRLSRARRHRHELGSLHREATKEANGSSRQHRRRKTLRWRAAGVRRSCSNALALYAKTMARPATLQRASPVQIHVLRSDARARRDLVNTASFKYRLAAGLGEFASGGNAA